MRDRPLRAMLIAAAALLAAGGSAGAGETRTLPVPAVTIYPGDTLRDEALTERVFPLKYPGVAAAIDGRSLLVGKLARRTLLPGKPIAAKRSARRTS